MIKCKDIKIKMNNGDIFHFGDKCIDSFYYNPYNNLCNFFFGRDSSFHSAIFIHDCENGNDIMINKENISSIKYEEEIIDE